MVAAVLSMVACNKPIEKIDDDPVEEKKTMPFTVTVGTGDPSTRATVESDYKTLYFAYGDELFVSGTGVIGDLSIHEGVGTASATFSGSLLYWGDEPEADLPLTATIVSSQQHTNYEYSAVGGVVTINYPTTSFCADVYEAVQRYSMLTGTSTYGAKSFSLSQQTAFLNFTITFEDGTESGAELSAVVSNNGSPICTANVTTTTENDKVVAKFVLPVPAGTVLSSATVQMGDKEALAISNATLSGKVYNVKRTQEAPPIALSITDPAVGQVICSDGKNYNYNSRPDGVTVIAKICYVDGSHGLALALTDEGSMNWNAAMEVCAAHKPAISSGGTWKLASMAEWEQLGADKTFYDEETYKALRDGFASVGGTNLNSYYYWSSSIALSGRFIYSFNFDNGDWNAPYEEESLYVRACLAF